ncbi:MAG: hypothetical protein IJA94_06200 [Bacilli bacterium]|nr:hypothetical protein [Bacilli bacterium]
MDYIKLLKEMLEFKIDIDKIMKNYANYFSFLLIDEKNQQELEQKIALYLVQNEIFNEVKIHKTFFQLYCMYAKNKLEKEKKTLEDLLLENPDLEYNEYFNRLAKNLNIEITIKKTCENNELPFTKTYMDSNSTDTITLLRNCTSIQINYVKSHLLTDELNILIKKFGKQLDSQNEISSKEETILKTQIIPKIDKMIKRYAGYYYYDQIFADQKNPYKMFGAFYSLDNHYKRLLLDCYGKELELPIDGVSKENEQELKKLVIPYLRNYNTKVTYYRRFALYQELINSNKGYIISMLPQGYIEVLKLAVDNTDKIFSTCSADFDIKTLTRGVKALLELLLTSEEFSLLDLHLGFSSNHTYTFSEISKLCNLSESKIESMYDEIIVKLRLSPHLIRVFNMLNKNRNNTLNFSEQEEQCVNNHLAKTNFYGFFTKDEMKLLQDAFFKLTLEEIEFVNKIFKGGLSESISLKTLSTSEQHTLELIINKTKSNISCFLEDECEHKILYNNIFKICSFIYCEPFYEDLVCELSREQIQILNLFMEFDQINETSLKLVAKKSNMSYSQICVTLRTILESMNQVFERVSKKNIIVRTLLEKNRFNNL